MDPMHDFYTPEEEIEVARRRDAGDGSAVAEMTARYDLLALQLANRSIRFRLSEADDLIAEARFGLFVAATRFDPNRGRFSTIADWCVRRHLQRYIRRNKSLVRVPEHLHNPKRYAESPEANREAADRALSLQTGRGAGVDSGTFLGQIPGRSEPAEPDDPDLDRLGPALRRLNDRHRLVLTLRFGLDGHGSRTQDEVGAELGVTRQRACQIEQAAFERIRQYLQILTPYPIGAAS